MISRKEFLKSVAMVGAVVMTGLHTDILRAEKKPSVEDAVKEVTGKSLGEAKETGDIFIQVPTIAESGANVPVKIEVNLPVEKVKAIHIFVDNNPIPYALGITISPLNGKGFIDARIRFAKTSLVRGIAVLADGSAIMAKQECKVTVGGCG